MRKIYFYFLTLSSLFGFSQTCPSNLNTYYSSATGTGSTLKTNLFNIIGPHTRISYSPGLWNLYYTSDVRPDGKVWDIYSNCNFIFGSVASGGNQDNGTGGSVECERYNREHTFPKSWFNNTGSDMYSDAFHVMPTDKKDNGARGNMPYGIVGGTATYTTNNGSKIGICTAANTPSNLTVFEPIDQYKGDVARNYFYMATCYQNLIGSWETNTTDANAVLDGSSFKVYEQWFLDIIYSWHINDPVSQKEIDRNNAVCAQQNNRNPYIDHPEWVQLIWGQFLSNDEFSQNAFSIQPNPSNGNFRIQYDSSIGNINVEIYSTLGQKVFEKLNINDNYISTNNLQKGVYLMKIANDTKTIVKKIVIN